MAQPWRVQRARPGSQAGKTLHTMHALGGRSCWCRLLQQLQPAVALCTGATQLQEQSSGCRPSTLINRRQFFYSILPACRSSTGTRSPKTCPSQRRPPWWSSEPPATACQAACTGRLRAAAAAACSRCRMHQMRMPSLAAGLGGPGSCWLAAAAAAAAAARSLRPAPLHCSCCSPPTAVRLLEEFVQLQEGDTLVQNGATSNVGRVSCCPSACVAGRGPWLCSQREAAPLGRKEGHLPPALYCGFCCFTAACLGAQCSLALHPMCGPPRLLVVPPRFLPVSLLCCPVVQYVIQLAKDRGIRTINIIRDRPDRQAVTGVGFACGRARCTHEPGMHHAQRLGAPACAACRPAAKAARRAIERAARRMIAFA